MGRCSEKDFENAVSEQIRLCRHHKHFRAYILVSSSSKLDAVETSIRRVTTGKRRLASNAQMRRSKYELRVMFENGSYICALVANDSLRGHRANHAIIDKEVDEKIVGCIIEPMLIGKYYETKKFFKKVAFVIHTTPKEIFVEIKTEV